jgi:hypothetical protein
MERVLLTDRLVRAARISGQIVAEFQKPLSGAEASVASRDSLAHDAAVTA